MGLVDLLVTCEPFWWVSVRVCGGRSREAEDPPIIDIMAVPKRGSEGRRSFASNVAPRRTATFNLVFDAVPRRFLDPTT